MSKHTPGPWAAPMHEGSTTGYVWAKEPHGGIVASVYDGGQNPPDREMRNANARLIAAAPEQQAKIERLEAINAELLDAACGAVKAISPEPGMSLHIWNESLKRATATLEAAIAKATGEPVK